jgi:hypothetical protein
MPDIFTRESVTEPPPTNLEIFPEYAHRLCLFRKAVMIPGIFSKPLFEWEFTLLENFEYCRYPYIKRTWKISGMG